ncbi:hypothetical protein AGMMS50249_5290 [candidate division SR1 bacterium]|nr:hypothetical protein AGMMS50249_5290 [candidate division SR1 bacterium]
MTKYFSLLLDLLNISDTEKERLDGIAEIIAHHTDKKLIIHHRLGFLFHQWREYLHDRLSLEDFLVTGDISSQQPILYDDTLSASIDLKETDLKLNIIQDWLEPDSMLLIDELRFFALSKSEQELLQSRSSEMRVIMLIC